MQTATSATEAAARAPLEADPAVTFATRQAAQILGLGEATIKRLADAGRLPAVREGRARRFPAAGLCSFLREADSRDFGDGAEIASAPAAAFAQATRAGKADLALADLISALAGGFTLSRALEELVEPALPLAPDAWFHDLLARVPTLDETLGRGKPAFVWSPAGRTGRVGSAACLLRGLGFDVLTPASDLGPGQLVGLALSAGIRVAIVVLHAAADSLAWPLQVAAEIARRCPEGSVVLLAPASARAEPPEGVSRASSIEAIASFLGASNLR